MKYILKNNRTGKEIPEFQTELEITFDQTHVNFEFYSKNSKFFSVSDQYNAALADGDVCEVFICVDESRTKYYEVEISPNGAEFLYLMTYKGFDTKIDEPILIEEPVEKSFLNSKVEIVGCDYKVKFSIPLNKIWVNENGCVVLNAFRIETEGGTPDKNLLALSPTMCNKFHHPEFFVEIKK